MGQRLAGGNVAIALLVNTVSTGAALVALILALGPISGAHFNPAVTIVDAWQKGVAWRDVPQLVAAQGIGAFAGVASAHLMFGEPLFSLLESRAERSGAGVQRVCRDVRVAFGDLGVFEAGPERRRLPLGPTSRRVLVHRLDLLCQPSRHDCQSLHGYIRGNQTRRCSVVHRCPVCRRARGNVVVPVADPVIACSR